MHHKLDRKHESGEKNSTLNCEREKKRPTRNRRVLRVQNQVEKRNWPNCENSASPRVRNICLWICTVLCAILGSTTGSLPLYDDVNDLEEGVWRRSARGTGSPTTVGGRGQCAALQ